MAKISNEILLTMSKGVRKKCIEGLSIEVKAKLAHTAAIWAAFLIKKADEQREKGFTKFYKENFEHAKNLTALAAELSA